MNPQIFQGEKCTLGLCTLANDDFIRIEWVGLTEFEELIDGMEEEFERIALQEYSKYGLLVEEGTKALVFHDEGDLEASINFGPAKKEGKSIVVEGGTNMVYALKLHEKPYGNKTHNKYENRSVFEDYYVNGKGERTRAKPSWRGYKPGRKYLQNAVNATEKDFDKMNERILKRFIDGD